MDEEARRREAIELLQRGLRPGGEVCRKLERSREWLSKWRRRFAAEGARGLASGSHAPRRHPWTTPARIVRAILAARDRLEHRGRGREFTGIGADAVAWELELTRARPLPSRRTIERVLARHGRRHARPWGHIPHRGPSGPATSSRPTSSGHATCARRRDHCASSPSTPSTSAVAASRRSSSRTRAPRASAPTSPEIAWPLPGPAAHLAGRQ